MTVNTKTFGFHLTAHTVKIIQEILFNMFPDSFCPSFKKTNHIILDSLPLQTHTGQFGTRLPSP